MLPNVENWFIGVGCALLLGLCLMFGVTLPENRPQLLDASGPPRLELPAAPVDLGVVKMDSVTHHRVALTNLGGEALEILKVESSCGCTTVLPEDKIIPPGKTSYLDVELDNSLKLGAIEKTIDLYTNDAKHPHQVLKLTAMAVAPKNAKVHGDGMLKVKDPLVLFKEDCASCHVERGVGKFGEELFIADCGMCHGLQAEGGVAGRLDTLDLSEPATRAYIRDIIANGAPHNPSMPPYSAKNGGPLSEQQIDSLVNFLAYLGAKEK